MWFEDRERVLNDGSVRTALGDYEKSVGLIKEPDEVAPLCPSSFLKVIESPIDRKVACCRIVSQQTQNCVGT